MLPSDWGNNPKYNVWINLKITEKCFTVSRTEYVAAKEWFSKN
jgi:hypothetical protein